MRTKQYPAGVGGVKRGLENFRLRRAEGDRHGVEIEIHRQLDLRQARWVGVELHRFGVAARQAFGVVMRLAGAQRGFFGVDEAGQVFQLQRMEMPAVLVRLQFAVVSVDVVGMIMMKHPETEMERPQQAEAVNQRRTDFEESLHQLDHTPGKGGVYFLSVEYSPIISKFKDLWQIFSPGVAPASVTLDSTGQGPELVFLLCESLS